MLITTYESQSINPSLVKFNATRPKLKLDKKKMYEKKNNSNIYNSIENKIRNNKRSQTSIKRNEDEIIEEILNGDRKYVLRLLKKESKVNKPVLLNHIDMSYQNSIIKKPNSNKSKSSVTLANIGLSIQKNLIGKRNITNYQFFVNKKIKRLIFLCCKMVKIIKTIIVCFLNFIKNNY